MSAQKFINFKILLIAFCFLLFSCAYAQTNKNKATKLEGNNENTATPNIEDFLKRQILLTNRARFTKDRTLEGASGFLIKYNGANFAVTARHLLGEAGGVEPEVKVSDLTKTLLKWEMLPRVVTDVKKETIKLNADNMDFSRSSSDILFLKIAANNFEIAILTPNFELPTVGETLFLIGCPYSETQCKQNSYPVKFVEFDETENSLVGEINSKVNLAGFSGAPLVNRKGEVLGALTSGGDSNGKSYVLATHIKEIQKIKF